VWRLYDQSGLANDLNVSGPAINNHADNNPVNATRHPLRVGGHKVYGAYFESGMGYRANPTTGIAINNEPETLYMVTSGKHVNPGCCFDYGNAEADPMNSSAFRDGTMEAISFTTFDASGPWCGGAGATGPWVLADLENGLWACGDAKRNDANVPLPFDFVTAMVKGGENGFALKGGDATGGTLTTLYDGPRPRGYQPSERARARNPADCTRDLTPLSPPPLFPSVPKVQKAGALILGMGGDNVARARALGIPTTAVGTYYEGAVTRGYSTDEADVALQADIVAARYGQ
jgi:hypothetical protein